MTSLKEKEKSQFLESLFHPRQIQELSQSRSPILSRDWSIGKHGRERIGMFLISRLKNVRKKSAIGFFCEALFFHGPRAHFDVFPLTHGVLGGKNPK